MFHNFKFVLKAMVVLASSDFIQSTILDSTQNLEELRIFRIWGIATCLHWIIIMYEDMEITFES